MKRYIVFLSHSFSPSTAATTLRSRKWWGQNGGCYREISEGSYRCCNTNSPVGKSRRKSENFRKDQTNFVFEWQRSTMEYTQGERGSGSTNRRHTGSQANKSPNPPVPPGQWNNHRNIISSIFLKLCERWDWCLDPKHLIIHKSNIIGAYAMASAWPYL